MANPQRDRDILLSGLVAGSCPRPRPKDHHPEPADRNQSTAANGEAKMIHKTFTVSITDDGILTGRNDGTQIMSGTETKAIMAYLLSHVLRMGELVGIHSYEEMEPIFELAKKIVMESVEVLN